MNKKENATSDIDLKPVSILDLYRIYSLGFIESNPKKINTLFSRLVIKIIETNDELSSEILFPFSRDLGKSVLQSICSEAIREYIYDVEKTPEKVNSLNRFISEMRGGNSFTRLLVKKEEVEKLEFSIIESESNKITSDESKIIFACYLSILSDHLENANSEIPVKGKQKKIKSLITTIFTKKYIIFERRENIPISIDDVSDEVLITTSKKSISEERETNSKKNTHKDRGKSSKNLTSREEGNLSKTSSFDELNMINSPSSIGGKYENRQKSDLRINVPKNTQPPKLMREKSESEKMLDEYNTRLDLRSPIVSSPRGTVMFPKSHSSRSSRSSTPMFPSGNDVSALLKKLCTPDSATKKKYYFKVIYTPNGIPTIIQSSGDVPSKYSMCPFHTATKEYKRMNPSELENFEGVYAYIGENECYDLCSSRIKLPVNKEEVYYITDFLQVLERIGESYPKDCDSVQNLVNDIYSKDRNIFLTEIEISKLYSELFEAVINSKNRDMIISLLRSPEFLTYKKEIPQTGKSKGPKEYEELFKHPDLIQGQLFSSALGFEQDLMDKFHMKDLVVSFCDVTELINVRDEILERKFEIIFGFSFVETEDHKSLILDFSERLSEDFVDAMKNFDEDDLLELGFEDPQRILSDDDESKDDIGDDIELMEHIISDLMKYSSLSERKNSPLPFQKLSLNADLLTKFIFSLYPYAKSIGQESIYIMLHVSNVNGIFQFATENVIFTDLNSAVYDLMNLKTKNAYVVIEITRVIYNSLNEEISRIDQELRSYENACYTLGSMYCEKNKYYELRNVIHKKINFFFFAKTYKQCCQIGSFLLGERTDVFNIVMNREISYENEFLLKVDDNVYNQALLSTQNANINAPFFTYSFCNEGDDTIYPYRAYSSMIPEIMSGFSRDDKLYSLNAKFFPLDLETALLTITMATQFPKNLSTNRLSLMTDGENREESDFIHDRQEITNGDLQNIKLGILLCGKFRIFVGSEEIILRPMENTLLKKRILGFDKESVYGCPTLTQIVSEFKSLDLMFLNAREKMLETLSNAVSKNFLCGVSTDDNDLNVLDEFPKLSMNKAVEVLENKINISNKLNRIVESLKIYEKYENNSSTNDNFFSVASTIPFFYNLDSATRITLRLNCPNSNVPFYTCGDSELDSQDISNGLLGAPNYSSIHLSDEIGFIFNLVSNNGIISMSDVIETFSTDLKTFSRKFEENDIEWNEDSNFVDFSGEISRFDLVFKFSLLMKIIDKFIQIQLIPDRFEVLFNYLKILLASPSFVIDSKVSDAFNQENNLARKSTKYYCGIELTKMISLILEDLKSELKDARMSLLELSLSEDIEIFSVLVEIFQTMNFNVSSSILNLRNCFENWFKSQVRSISLLEYRLMKQSDVRIAKKVEKVEKKKEVKRTVQVFEDDDDDEILIHSDKNLQISENDSDSENENENDEIYNCRGKSYRLERFETRIREITILDSSKYCEEYITFIQALIPTLNRICTWSSNLSNTDFCVTGIRERLNFLRVVNPSERVNSTTLTRIKNSCSFNILTLNKETLRRYYYPLHENSEMNVSSNFNSVYDSRNFGTFSKTLKSFKDILEKLQSKTKTVGVLSKKLQDLRTESFTMFKTLDERSVAVTSSYALATSIPQLIIQLYKDLRVDSREFKDAIYKVEKFQTKFSTKISKINYLSTNIFNALNSIVVNVFETRKGILNLFSRYSGIKEIINSISEDIPNIISKHFPKNRTEMQNIDNELQRLLSLDIFSNISSTNLELLIARTNEFSQKEEAVNLVKYEFISKYFNLLRDNYFEINKKSLRDRCSAIVVNFENYGKGNSDELSELLNSYTHARKFSDIRVRSVFYDNDYLRYLKAIESTVTLVLDSLAIIDSGPGIHFTIDLIDILQSIKKSSNSLSVSISHKYRMIGKMCVLIYRLGRLDFSYERMINNRNFRRFVSLINGTMTNFDIEESLREITLIPLFDVVYDKVTESKVYEVLNLFSEISKEIKISCNENEEPNEENIRLNGKIIKSVQNGKDSQLNKSVENIWKKIENVLEVLTPEVLNDMNLCFRNVLDEYIAESSNSTEHMKHYCVINDSLLLKLRNEIIVTERQEEKDGEIKIVREKSQYVIKTSGKFLTRYIRNINSFIREKIEEEENYIFEQIVKNFFTYVSILFKDLKAYPSIDVNLLEHV